MRRSQNTYYYCKYLFSTVELERQHFVFFEQQFETSRDMLHNEVTTILGHVTCDRGNPVTMDLVERGG